MPDCPSAATPLALRRALVVAAFALAGLQGAGAQVTTVKKAPSAFGATTEAAHATAPAAQAVQPFALKPAPTLATPAAAALPAARPAVGALAASPSATATSAGHLYGLEDRAIIIVSGRPSTAGELKRQLAADLTAAAGPPRAVPGGSRKLDLVALNVASGGARAALTAAPMLQTRSTTTPAPGLLKGLSSSTTATDAPGTSALLLARSTTPLKASAGALAVDKGSSVSAARCLDKGPPAITEVKGALKPGAQLTIWGRCLGDRPGRVEVIGQFPGGKLTLPFTAWDMTGVTVEMPATVRGAGDHAVAISIVTADGRTSPAMQASFVAARERVPVPDALWSPTAGFELAATVETLNTATAAPVRTNPAAGGQVSKSLRVNPQCALDNMDTLVLSGGVSRVSGFENGPPNEAHVAIDWVGTCTGTKTTTSYHYVIGVAGDDTAITSACRVAFQARAWAYCPAGVAP